MRAEEQATDGRREFIRYLRRLSQDSERSENPAARSRARASIARLRRGLGQAPGACMETLEELAPYLPEEIREEEVEAFFLVGSLFGLHPRARLDSTPPGQSFGAALREAFRAGDGTVGGPTEATDSAERRFAALLGSRRELLPDRLRQALSILHSKAPSLPLDYDLLLSHLIHWDREDRSVQLRWARDYWRPAPKSDEKTPESLPGSEE